MLFGLFAMVQPRRLMLQHVNVLGAQMPGVWDGQPPSIHDARVTIRRIRELLPLTDSWKWRPPDDLEESFRRAGRALGRVRELDVHLALIWSLQRRVPTSACALALVRQRFEEERSAVARTLVKKLEQLDITNMLSQLVAHKPSMVEFGARLARRNHWRSDLRGLVLDRARSAREAINHATGVYMPNRLHAARIAVKRLRYAMEASQATDSGDGTRDLRQLRKAQEILGELHDRERLIDAIEAWRAGQQRDEMTDQIAVVIGVVRAECQDLHERYLARRGTVIQICEQAERHARSARVGRALAIGVLGVSVGYATQRLTMVGRRSPQAGLDAERVLSLA
jgi:CHAD domain-containing protein